MKKKLAYTILFFCLAFGGSTSLFGQEVKLLQGFDTCKILIEDLPNELIKAGLTDNQIRTDVEIKLRQAKIKIAGSSTNPYISFYVNLSAIETNDGLIAFHLNISLLQSVVLERDRTISTISPTWTKNIIGVVGRNRVNTIRENIKDITDEFILDYLKANESPNASQVGEFDEDAFVKSFIKDQPPKKTDSPFTSTYIGGNGPPEVEIFNDSDRTIYIDIGQGKLTAYTILSKKSISLKLVNGNYNYKASAARVSPLQGINEFRTGYRYTWRFTILKR
jgi:hypothetical protein